MPITKLSAPQPHELVSKVNELVDAVNSGGGGGGGECAGTLKVATFMAPCDLLMKAYGNPEGGWEVYLGFNVTDNGDGTITLSDFGFTYDLNATFFRDYWFLLQMGDETDRISIQTFLDALVEMGIIKPNPQYGMGVVKGFDSNDEYIYIAFLICECPPDTEDSSPLQELTYILSLLYPQIGYTIPEITEYEYNPLSLGGVSKTTTDKTASTSSTSHKTTIIDRLKSILEARRNDDIQRH